MRVAMDRNVTPIDRLVASLLKEACRLPSDRRELVEPFLSVVLWSSRLFSSTATLLAFSIGTVPSPSLR